METAAKATLAGGQVIVAEVIFWLGAAVAGPDAARRMRTWWRRKSDSTSGPSGVEGGEA